MDSFELNKIIGAILGTLLFVMGLGFLAEAIYAPVQGAGGGYALPAPEGDEGTGEAAEGSATTVADIGTLLAAADPKAGEASAKKCQACHDFTKGGPNKTGPNLYDVVERVIGSHPGFSYSAVLLEHQAKGDTWTYENLNHFITSPKGFAPGTKMTFAGIKDDADRANVIAFLSTLSDSPKPFPAPAQPAAGDAAPSGQTESGTASAATSVETPATTDPNGTNSPGTGTATEVPAGADTSSAAPASSASEAAAPSTSASAASGSSSSVGEASSSSSAAQ